MFNLLVNFINSLHKQKNIYKMANVNDNRVDAIFNQEALQKIDDLTTELLSMIPDVALTDDERGKMVSMDVDNKVFAEDVLKELNGPAKSILPTFISATRYENDLVLADQADTIHAKLANVARRITDLQRVASSETMATASLVYNFLLAADKAGVSGAKEPATKLKKRYERLGRKEDQGT
jgi:hypothetical protein